MKTSCNEIIIFMTIIIIVSS